MNARSKTSACIPVLLFLTALVSAPARASVVAVGPAAFPAGSTLLTFDGLPTGTEVNGLTVAGVRFTYSLGNGIVEIDGGPGITNNVSPQNVVSIGNPSGTLRVILPGFFDTFGFGFAILNVGAVPNAATINLFSGASTVGSLSYSGAPDPTFAGGFAGIQSTVAFDNVGITFNSTAAPAFALDNIRIGSAVPEPSACLLVLGGAALLGWRRLLRA